MKLIVFLTLTLIYLLQAQSYSLTQNNDPFPSCFWRLLRDIDCDIHFTYTITQQWTEAEAAQLKSGALNTSDYIDVQGWTPYNPAHPFDFFTQMGR